MQAERPIIDYAKPPRQSRYPIREWIVPLFLFLLPFLVIVAFFAWVVWEGPNC